MSWIAVLIASGAFALGLSLAISAVQIAGVNSMALAHVLIILAALVGTAAIWFSGWSFDYRILGIVATCIVLGGFDWWMVKKKAKQGAAKSRATISYPWLDTNYLVVDGNKEVKEIRLQIRVHDEPAAPDAQKGVMTISSLHNLKLDVWMPVAFNETAEGSDWCPVGSLDEVEWNNHKAASVIGMIELKNDTTLALGHFS
jgi:hypothetical protein